MKPKGVLESSDPAGLCVRFCSVSTESCLLLSHLFGLLGIKLVAVIWE